MKKYGMAALLFLTCLLMAGCGKSDPDLKKKIKDHVRESAATSNGKEFEPISETEFIQAIEQENVTKVFEAKE